MLWKILILIFPIIFNVTFFSVAGAAHPTSVWISYAFIHLSYFMLPAIPFLTKKYHRRADLVRPLYLISSVYFGIELAVGMVFIFLRQESINPAFITQFIMAGVFAALFISNLFANHSTHESVTKHEREVCYIKEIASRVYVLMDKLSDREANRTIERTYDILHGSPSKSDPSVTSLEQHILSMIPMLENAVHEQDCKQVIEIASKIQSSIEERNRKLKNR